MSKNGKYLNPKDAVRGYLDARAKDDELFAKMYAKENKNLSGCWAYIVGVAKKRGNSVCMTDDEVYGLAVHYYCEDDLKVNPIPEGMEYRMSTSENVRLSDADKAKLRAEAEAEFKAKVLKELESVEAEERKAAEAARVKAERDAEKAAEKERKRAEAEKKKREKEAAKVEAKRMQTAGMGCLFDF